MSVPFIVQWSVLNFLSMQHLKVGLRKLLLGMKTHTAVRRNTRMLFYKRRKTCFGEIFKIEIKKAIVESRLRPRCAAHLAKFGWTRCNNFSCYIRVRYPNAVNSRLAVELSRAEVKT